MKKLLILLTVFCALLSAPAARAAGCTTPPIVTGSISAMSATPPSTEWIPSFYRWSSNETYSAKFWTSNGVKAKISFGADSAIMVLTGADCVAGACSAFTGSRITTLFAPNVTLPTGHRLVEIIANGVKVAQLFNVWNLSGLSTTESTWSDGISAVTESAAAGPSSKLYFEGWHTDATHTFHKGIRLHLANDCGTLE